MMSRLSRNIIGAGLLIGTGAFLLEAIGISSSAYRVMFGIGVAITAIGVSIPVLWGSTSEIPIGLRIIQKAAAGAFLVAVAVLLISMFIDEPYWMAALVRACGAIFVGGALVSVGASWYLRTKRTDDSR